VWKLPANERRAYGKLELVLRLPCLALTRQRRSEVVNLLDVRATHRRPLQQMNDRRKVSSARSMVARTVHQARLRNAFTSGEFLLGTSPSGL
jgi:hypothetical protein